MRFLVDADACPVNDIIKNIAKEKNIETIFFIDEAHDFYDDDFKVIKSPVGKDSVDLAIIKNIKEGDIVITQDFGLAALSLSKKALAINQNGLIFTNNNIDHLLMERFINKEKRKAKLKTKNPSKRKKEDNSYFEKKLRSLLE